MKKKLVEYCKYCFLNTYCICKRPWRTFKDSEEFYNDYNSRPNRRPYGSKHRTCTDDVMNDDCISYFNTSILAKHIYEKNGWEWDHDPRKCDCFECMDSDLPDSLWRKRVNELLNKPIMDEIQ